MFEFFITSFLLLCWPSLTPRHEKSFLAVHSCTRANPPRGYAENAGRPKSVCTRRVGARRITRKCCASKACSSQRPIPIRQSRFRTNRNCNPHDLPFSLIVAPTAAPDFRIRRGTAVAHVCKLVEEPFNNSRSTRQKVVRYRL